MSEATTVAIARRDGRRAERAPVVATHEGEDQILARRVAHDLQRVFNRLCAADVEMNTPLNAKLGLVESRDGRREFDLFRVQILAGELRQLINLILERVVQTLIAVAEARRRIPHLQI